MKENLIKLDTTIDFANEKVASIEPDGSSEEEELYSHDQGVSHVENGRGQAVDMEFGKKVEHSV